MTGQSRSRQVIIVSIMSLPLFQNVCSNLVIADEDHQRDLEREDLLL